MNRFTAPLILSIGLFLLGSCSKDNNSPATGKGTAQLKFENYAGTEPLVLYTNGLPGQDYPYVNANGDSFNVNLYKYYISNVRLVKEGGGEYAEVESYHLINQANPSSLSFNMTDVPEGNYTAVKLLMGVDSARNVSGAQTGDLDPLKDMFWTWNSGYIMAKVEGKSARSSREDKSIVFHLGGYYGMYSVLKEITLPLPQNLIVKNGTSSSVTLRSDLLKWFGAPNVIDFGILNSAMGAGKDALSIAENYSKMLSVTKVEN